MHRVLSTIKTLFLYSCIALALCVVSQARAEFDVKITGKKNFLETYQKRAELKLVRSTSFCRGFYLPRLISEWSCTGVGGGESECVARFKCDHVNKNYSKLTETRRLVSELKTMPRTGSSFAMVVGKKKLKSPNRRRHVRRIENKRAKARAEEVALLEKNIQKRADQIKGEMTEFDEFERLEKELAIDRVKNPDKQRKNSVDEFSASSLNEDRAQMDETLEDVAPFRMERIKSVDGDEELIKISKHSETIPEDEIFEFFSFSGSMISVSDDNGSSLSTIDLAWTPLWRYGKTWNFRGRFGIHNLEGEDDEGNGESFLVFDIAGGLEWHLFDGGLYASTGLGLQNWTSTTDGGAYTSFYLGGGYQFDFNKLKIIDRVFVRYAMVGNTAANKELTFGFGVTF